MESAMAWLREEGFKLVAARDLIDAPQQVKNRMGVYLVFIKGADKIFQRAGLPDAGDVSYWSVGDYHQLYVGEGVSVRSRAMYHLHGDVSNSAVREFLLSLQFARGVIWRATTECRESAEARLDEWLLENAAIAFKNCAFAGDVERDLIRQFPSPFNVRHNARTPLLSALIDIRDGYREHLAVTGQRPARSYKSPSAWLRADAALRKPS